MITHRRIAVAAVAAAAVTLGGIAAATTPARASKGRQPASRHVLLLSVDGMHQADLDYWTRTHPTSALAGLVHRGAEYTNAATTFPSDSFPGMIAQLTGGGAGTTGVYYDDTYNRGYFPPGTRDCSGKAPGSEIPWTEVIDRSQNPITLDAGQQLPDPALTRLTTNTKQQTLDDSAAITAAILHMTPTPQALLDPAALPVDPASCLPEYPHQYLRTNTVFDVVKRAGLRTAWSDKHPAYEILAGRDGTSIDDLFTPEINAVADSAGDDWATDNALTQEYDDTKVAALVNEIDGYDHSGTRRVGTPAIFGMNFQSVSTAQKLPKSGGLTGGYRSDGTPGPVLQSALAYVDREVGLLTTRLRRDGLAASTTVILSAKHGQSPVDPGALRRVDDGKIIDGVNAAWQAQHPGASPLVTFSVDDDAMLLWLSDRSAHATEFVKSYLLGHDAPANTVNDAKGVYSTAVTRSGLQSVSTGVAADRLVGAPRNDSRTPDVIGIVQHGVVYTGGVKKISEHGGASAEDRHVPLVVSGAGVNSDVNASAVQTTQIAPTILTLLGLSPRELDAVRSEHTAALPELRRRHRCPAAVPASAYRHASCSAHDTDRVRVLVVDDDVDVADMLRRGLGDFGHRVDIAENGTDAIWRAGEFDYEVIVLDVMLPDQNGFEVCRRLRSQRIWTPVLMLSARGDTQDKVTGLQHGADDYLAKPFGFDELAARLQALARRGATPRPVRLLAGNLWLDPATREVGRDETHIELSATEFALLEVFLRHPDMVLTRTVITDHIGDWAFGSTSNVVDQYVSYLRRKVDRPFGLEQLVTVRGAGYRLLQRPRRRTG